MASGFLLVPNGARLPTLSGLLAIPGAVVTLNAVQWSLYYTNQFADAVSWIIETDSQIQWRRRKRDLPWAFIRYLVAVLRRDSANATNNPAWKRLADCGPADYFRVDTAAGGVAWRRIKVVQTAPDRFRPDLGEKLKEVRDIIGVFAGETVATHTGGRIGFYNPATDVPDRATDD